MKPHPRGHNGLKLTNSESYYYIYALKTVEELNKNGYAYFDDHVKQTKKLPQKPASIENIYI